MNLLRWSRSAFAVSVLAVSSIGCSDPVGPRIDMVYAATTVGGNPLPATSGPESGHEIILLADTLEFYSNGEVEMTTVLKIGGMVATPQRFTSTWTYTIVGQRLTLVSPPCPPNALCVGPFEGDINTDRVWFPYSMNLGPDAGEFVLRRVE